MLAAIEVYNKPIFEYREETYAILAVNAWELLLKARILQIDNNKTLDPGNLNSAKKKFYSPNIIREFDKQYRRKK